ncbi:MAG: pitrilysin family protein [Gammaproteobacteria bacterium]
MAITDSTGRAALRRGWQVLLLWALSGTLALAMPPIQHWQTANGVRVYFVPAPELPMVDVRLVFAAGSARDAGQAGLARMTNLLLDKGAAGLSAGEIAIRLESLGANLGTGALRDMAWVSLRSLSDAEHLQPALAVFRDVVSRPDFNKRDMERERANTLVAIRSGEQSPATVAGYNFYAACYGEHMYGTRSVGTEDSVKKLSRSAINAFYRRYYVARNAVLAIVGDLDRKAAEDLAEQVAGALPAGDRAPPIPPVESLQQAQEERIFHPSTQTHVRMGAPGMHRGDPDYFTLYVGNHVLGGGGLVSRLHEEVREKRGLSYSVNSYFSPMEQDGPFLLSLQTRNDQVEEALAVARKTLQDFIDKGPTEAELTASKKNITGGFALRIDSNAKIVEYLAMIGFYDLPLDYLDTFNDKVMAVSRQQVVDTFRRRVVPGKMVTVIVGGDS